MRCDETKYKQLQNEHVQHQQRRLALEENYTPPSEGEANDANPASHACADMNVATIPPAMNTKGAEAGVASVIVDEFAALEPALRFESR